MQHRRPRVLRRRRHRGSEDGAVAVEFGLIVPILLLLVFGIMDFGYMLNRDMLVDNASRDGVRVASLGGSFSQVCTAVKTELSSSGLKTPTNCNSTAVLTAAAPTSIKIDCIKANNTACSATSATYDSLAVSGTTAVVTIKYRYGWITPIPSTFMGSSVTLTQTSQMVVE